MGTISWIVFGLLAGAIAKYLMPGRDPGGCFVTIILGIVGAFVGGWIGTRLGIGSVNEFDIGSLFVAVGGSVIILWIYRLLATGREH